MKTGKFVIIPAVLSLLVISVPMVAYSGLKDYVELKPADDQPWGGEIDLGDYKDGNIYSVEPVTDPVPSTPVTIRHIGTPMVLLDYIKNLFFGRSTLLSGSYSSIQTKTRSYIKPADLAPSSIRSKRLSSPKGR